MIETQKERMEITDYPLTCNRISRKSMKNESSDYAILPAHLRPSKPNVFGYYVFKVTSDMSDHWTYCRVIEWSAGEHDCYLPTVGFRRRGVTVVVDDELPAHSGQVWGEVLVWEVFDKEGVFVVCVCDGVGGIPGDPADGRDLCLLLVPGGAGCAYSTLSMTRR